LHNSGQLGLHRSKVKAQKERPVWRNFLLAGLLFVSLLGVSMIPATPGRASSVIVVTTTSDAIGPDGLCSLREAVIAANSNTSFNGCPAGSGADTIDLSSNFPAPTTFQISIPGANENAALTGDLDLQETLTIIGAGPDNTRISGNGVDRVLQTLANARVSITGVAVQNGNPGSGAAGGGIQIDATGVLTLTQSTVQNNIAANGAGIRVAGTLSASDATIAANQGGGIDNAGGRVTLTRVNVTGNSAGYGIRNTGSGSLSMHGGQVSNNLAGGLYNDSSSAVLSEVRVLNNAGGGVYNTGVVRAVLTIERSQISGNNAFGGAGIFNSGIGTTVTISSSQISGNTATGNGGGVSNNGIMSIVSSTIEQNQAASGGGINHLGGQLGLTNVTIADNTVTDNGAGLYNRSDTTVLNTTMNHNLAGGPGTGGNVFNDTSSISFRNTILANPAGEDNCLNSEGFIISSGNNLESGDTCGFNQASDQKTTDPLLGPLQNNGGSTFTFALLPGSPAIDAGTNTLCPATDQRNATRPVDGDGNGSPICDIGAYEYSSNAPVIVDLAISQSDHGAIAQPGGIITYDITYTNLGNVAVSGVVITDTLPLHTHYLAAANPPGWAQWGTEQVYRYTLPSLAVSASGHITLTVRLDNQNPPAVNFVDNSVRIGDNGANGPEIDLSDNVSLIHTPTQAGFTVFIPMVWQSNP
jgi:uncharacterized repeat protein (TIGR01451 family)/CSLREA domain-containing protein